MVASDLARAAILGLLWLVARRVGLTVPLCSPARPSSSRPRRRRSCPRATRCCRASPRDAPLVRFNAVFQVGPSSPASSGSGSAACSSAPARPRTSSERGRVLDVLALDGAHVPRQRGDARRAHAPRRPPRAPTRARATACSARRARGVATCVRDPLLLALLVLTALDNLAIMGPAIVGAAGFVHDDLGLEAGHFAWFEGTMASGYVVGALLVARFATRARKGPLILWGMVLDGLTYVPFFWVRSYALALPLIFLHGLFIPWIVVGRTTLLQQHVPEARARSGLRAREPDGAGDDRALGARRGRRWRSGAGRADALPARGRLRHGVRRRRARRDAAAARGDLTDRPSGPAQPSGARCGRRRRNPSRAPAGGASRRPRGRRGRGRRTGSGSRSTAGAQAGERAARPARRTGSP